MVQADNPWTTLVLYPADYDDDYVHGCFRRDCKDQYRRTSATAVLFGGNLPLAVFCRKFEPNEQNVHRQCKCFWKGLFSAFGRSDGDRDKQPGAPCNSDGALLFGVRVLHDFYGRARAPEPVFAFDTGANFDPCWACTRIWRAVQQPHDQIPRPYFFADFYCATLDVRNAGNLPAQHHRKSKAQIADAGESAHKHYGNI